LRPALVVNSNLVPTRKPYLGQLAVLTLRFLLMRLMNPKRIFFGCVAGALVAGCSSISTPLMSSEAGAGGGSTATSVVAYSGIEMLGQNQLPPGTRILLEQSLIMGSGENWVGRVTMNVGRDITSAYVFFIEKIPQRGWTLLLAVRGKTSLLVFTKAERNLAIEMQEGNVMNGASVAMTVSPRNATQVPAKKP